MSAAPLPPLESELWLVLPRDCFTVPTRLHLLELQVWMLWSHDPQMRERARKTGLIEYGLLRHETIDRVELVNLLKVARDLTPIDSEKERAAMANGERAGAYLRRTIALLSVFPNAKSDRESAKKSATAEVVSALNSDRISPIKPKTFQTEVWRDYQAVAHFWAARLDAVQAHDEGVAGWEALPFPCNLVQFPKFLGLAEGYRQLGERMKSRQSPWPVLQRSVKLDPVPDGLVVVEPEFCIRHSEHHSE
jgi:hypothetical protein